MENRYLLVVKFFLFDAVTIAALFAGYMEGWMDGMLAGPTLLITFGVFLFGLIICGAKIWRTSQELNDFKTGMPPPETRAENHLKELELHDGESRSIKIPGVSPRRRHATTLLLVAMEHETRGDLIG